MPSRLSGAARVFDLGGVFDEYNVSVSGSAADFAALLSDWHRVGDDLRLSTLAACTDLEGSELVDLVELIHKRRADEGAQLRLMDA